ncbi:hypothetical protein AOXY_G2928 [Acipenser oxyrinchus oxyrinchus]|uniref:Ig-like domain-containing protein n=1 Tax=Acipenser oxyrinchus oxyrinchus TaxID=40147 RepID=A0AAD8GJ37_ACIOX|nr:hypothetical protein AOXY_G2928 [Acipenser oxyrinchus oxyrinchus]
MNKLTMLQGYLFLANWYSIGAKGEINITQSPPAITAKEGESVQMNCSWKTLENAQQIRAEWWKNQSRIISLFSKQNYLDVKGNNASFTMLINANSTELRIANLTQNHTGIYHCSAIAEIPTLKKGNGSGTVLYVHEVQNNSSLGSGAAVGVLLAMLFVLLIITLLWKRKILMSRAQDQGEAAADYESVLEMDAIEGPQEAAEANSSSSQGSTQWAEITVYESCDYFDVKSNENEDDR